MPHLKKALYGVTTVEATQPLTNFWGFSENLSPVFSTVSRNTHSDPFWNIVFAKSLHKFLGKTQAAESLETFQQYIKRIKSADRTGLLNYSVEKIQGSN